MYIHDYYNSNKFVAKIFNLNKFLKLFKISYRKNDLVAVYSYKAMRHTSAVIAVITAFK